MRFSFVRFSAPFGEDSIIQSKRKLHEYIENSFCSIYEMLDKLPCICFERKYTYYAIRYAIVCSYQTKTAFWWGLRHVQSSGNFVYGYQEISITCTDVTGAKWTILANSFARQNTQLGGLKRYDKNPLCVDFNQIQAPNNTGKIVETPYVRHQFA